MYALIDEAKNNIQECEVYGVVTTASGSEFHFTGEDIEKGSVRYQNQCSETSDWKMSYVKTASFSAVFYDTLGVPRNSWIDAVITPFVKIGDTRIPVGVFHADTISHEGGTISVSAYDAMTKFDKVASVSELMNGQVYDWLSLVCAECNVTLGMTREDVESLPNGNKQLILAELGDIQTWRDVLYWIGITVASFCTINRAGALELRTYHSEYDDVLPAYIRISKSKYGDGSIKYTGLNVTVRADATVEYYSQEVDDGYTLNIGTNPFFQVGKAMRETYMPDILSAMQNINYTTCDVVIPFGVQYDLGDVLQFPDGNGDARQRFCIMYISWTLNGECAIKSIPLPKASMSKTDKNIQGLLNATEKDSYQDYEQKNVRPITIGDNQEQRIASVRLASNNSTKALIHIEVNLESTANAISDSIPVEIEGDEELSGTASGDDIFRLVSESETTGVVRYLINAEEVSFKPIEQWTDGNHILHLMYVLPLEQGIPVQFDAYLKAEGGTIKIPQGGVWFYGSGRGLVGDGKWDGTFNIEEEASSWNLIELEFKTAGESCNIASQEPETISLSDNAGTWELIEIGFAGVGDIIDITMHADSKPRITEDGKIRVTENGGTRYTEGE